MAFWKDIKTMQGKGHYYIGYWDAKFLLLHFKEKYLMLNLNVDFSYLILV